MLTEPKTVKVLIVSANPFVMDFLKGLVEIHGYHTEKETDFHEALIRVHDGLADVVFIDDGCLDVENSKTFQLRTQELIQEGAPIILLTNEQLKQDLEQQLPRSFFRIVRKPVGYLQIGQVMADLMTV